MNTRFLFENVLENAVLSATDTAAGYDVNNLLDRRSFTKWRANSYGTKYITGVFTAANSHADTVAIFGHNFFSIGASVTIEFYDDTDASWTEIAAFTITKDGAIAAGFTLETHADRWRVKIVTTPGNIAECALILIGQSAVFPFPPNAPHTDFVQKGLNESAVSKTGNLIGVVNRGDETTFQLSFAHLLRTWTNTWLLNWWWPDYGKLGKPFIYVPDLDYDDEEVYLVKCADEYQFQLPKSLRDYYDNVSFDLIGMRL